tara:strand:- start:884 stop:1222 length:339 start_codon:yes stop_codon:yes gene_type:complete
MADVLKSTNKRITTADGSVFTDTVLQSPSGKTCTIIGINFAAITQNTVQIRCTLVKNATSSEKHLIGLDTDLPNKSAIYFENKHVLESQDSIKVTCNTNDAVDVTLSYLEQS